MKYILFFLIAVILLTGCSPSPAEILSKTSAAQTSIAQAWTTTPPPSATQPPSPTPLPTATSTPAPSATTSPSATPSPTKAAPTRTSPPPDTATPTLAVPGPVVQEFPDARISGVFRPEKDKEVWDKVNDGDYVNGDLVLQVPSDSVNPWARMNMKPRPGWGVSARFIFQEGGDYVFWISDKEVKNLTGLMFSKREIKGMVKYGSSGYQFKRFRGNLKLIPGAEYTVFMAVDQQNVVHMLLWNSSSPENPISLKIPAGAKLFGLVLKPSISSHGKGNLVIKQVIEYQF